MASTTKKRLRRTGPKPKVVKDVVELKLQKVKEDLELKLLEDSLKGVKAANAYTDSKKLKCDIIGCRNSKSGPKVKYCHKHSAENNLGKILDDIPLPMWERAKHAYYYVTDAVAAIKKGEIQPELIKQKFFDDICKLMCAIDLEKLPTVQPFLEYDQQFNNSIKEKAMYLNSKKILERKLLDGLSYAPLEFQLAEYSSDGETMTLKLLAKVDTEVNGKKGHLDSRGFFLEREFIQAFFERVFKFGRKVKVHSYTDKFPSPGMFN